MPVQYLLFNTKYYINSVCFTIDNIRIKIRYLPKSIFIFLLIQIKYYKYNLKQIFKIR